ncbi:serine hydrolase FSH [Annulohypoxylon bovei var. microspora]|nr:serine hydrolase FSH [Annulohypoxylon bovei var. microspora]
MKILCLHGNGTNSGVLEMQIAPLRHELEEDHEYEFVEGVLEAPSSARVEATVDTIVYLPGIEALTSPTSRFYGFYDPDALSTLQDSIILLDKYITAEGPFDAILGFSAGAVLAMLYMRDKQRRGEPLPLKCGIFVASAAISAEEEYLGFGKQHDVGCIPIPTAHIWGAHDKLAPTGGQDVSRMCEPAICFTLVHDGGHEFPRKQHLTEAAKVVQRAMQLAQESILDRA